jgi:hypothetical protein
METTVMKTNRFNSLLRSAILSSTIATSLFASVGSVKAQNTSSIRVRIPFAFQVGPTQMPAGSYYMSVLLDHRLVQLRGQGSGKQPLGVLLATPSESGKVQKTVRLIFHRYGDRYFLREVWDANTDEGVRSGASSEEKEILRSQNHQAVTQTQLAFNVDPNR